MHEIHLAEYGHRMGMDEDGRVRVLGLVPAPKTTLCGRSVTHEAVKTLMPHDDPGACRACLKRLPSRSTDRVQPILFPAVAMEKAS